MTPCEKAFAVSSAELTRDFPSTVTESVIFPSFTSNKPLYGDPLEVMDISSAIDLE